MGTSLNATLEIANQTLQNTQVAIQTSSHNIANADNTSYARQVVQLVTNPPQKLPNAWVGTGANVSNVVQQRDQFIESQLMDATTQKSGYETLSSQLTSASAILSDNGDTGISQALGAFWDAWDNLSQDPSGTSASTAVQSAANNLANTIQQTYNNISDFIQGFTNPNNSTATTANTQGLTNQINSDVNQVNTLLSNIAQANKAIVKSEAGGQMANDLRDSRYQDITQLAQLLPIQSTQNSNGSVTISLTYNGQSATLVDGDKASNLAYSFDKTKSAKLQYSNPTFTFTDSTGNTTSFSNGLGGGTLDSLNQVYQEFLSPATGAAADSTIMGQLNQFTNTLINSVNSANGSDVFTADANGRIQVVSGFVPSSSNASDVSKLQDDQTQAALGDATFAQYLGNIQQQLGSKTSNATTQASFQDSLYQQLQARQQAVSGVSVDDEMVNIIKDQQVYAAAAKIIQTASGMLNTVIDAV